ncbi:MAG: alpha/beta hydrolase [Actinomycetes bacterium]
MTLKFFTRKNGDRVDYFDGEVGADLLIYHHGTPGAGPLHADVLDPALASDLRIVELIRPGYGNSTRQPNRTVADVVTLADELADHLGFMKYVTMGWSGGGPHALANAALSPGRCVASMSLAGVGMYGQSDLDFLAGMGQDNHDEFGAALLGESTIRGYLEPIAVELKDITGSQIVDVMGSLLPDEDRAALTGEYGENQAEVFRWAIHTGVDGWLDDDIAFTKPWGFDLGEIKNPVAIWQGATDLMVPLAHGKWLASKIPNAQVNLIDGHGHLSIGELALANGLAWLKEKFSE